jgi:diguanylate cyclase
MFSLVLLDLDHFKSLNDNYSHLLGDSVIRAVSNRLKSISRDGVSAYRYGGEEFALIVPNKDLRLARHYAENTRRLIEKISVRDKQSGQTVSSITASFGVAEFQGKESATSLIARADKLLYEAKQLGRNRVMPIQ